MQDEPAQSDVARRLVARAVASGSTLFVPVTVILELEWVLRSSFALTKDEILQALSRLASAMEVCFEAERAVEVALHLFRKTSADFADCIHVALSGAAGQAPLWTFDRKAARLEGAILATRA